MGGGEADRGVSVGEALIVSGNVEGIMGGVSVAVVSFWSPEAQLVLRSRIRMTRFAKRRDTAGF